jgi:para-nitrobenzyl esterase
MPSARIEMGTLSGAREGGVLAFRGVPYAAPPLGARRFLPPSAPDAWSGVRDATRNGPVPPQLRSRLADVMGECPLETGEDCLTLTIWTPANDAQKRPVLVWLHGGAFSSGAGSLDCYSGAKLAERGDLVVVGVNYRLGVLGYLYAPGISDGNLGLLDQLAALRWVRDNIAAFGGDPSAVTLCGQSAGAMSALMLMTMPQADGLFARAILQSPAMTRMTRTAADAAAIGVQFREKCGARDLAAMQAVPVADLMRVQGELSGVHARFADAAPLFAPVIDGSVIPRDPLISLLERPGPNVEILMGTTREESGAFCAIDPRIINATPDQVAGVFAREFGDRAAAEEAGYRRRRPGSDALALLTDVLSDQQFLMQLLAFADWRSSVGRPAHVYQFDWSPPHTPKRFGACHCIELPFVFGYGKSWSEAPMLGDAQAREIEALSNVIQQAWIAFTKTGDPGNDALPPWPRYDTQRRTTMRFDRIVGPVDDLAGLHFRRPFGA